MFEYLCIQKQNLQIWTIFGGINNWIFLLVDWNCLCFILMSLSPLSPSERSLESVGRSRHESLSSVEEDDYDTLDDIDSDKNIVRTKVLLFSPFTCTSYDYGNVSLSQDLFNCTINNQNVFPSLQKFLCVSDLARKDKRVLSKKYQIYFWWGQWFSHESSSSWKHPSTNVPLCKSLMIVSFTGTSPPSQCFMPCLSSSWSSPIRRYDANIWSVTHKMLVLSGLKKGSKLVFSFSFWN